ncbi:RidA family protein [Paenibacillus hamazuiensis]|uniref:RidA family protein n=1 Tax=Paenibacillus hamazuiensis TaxID=2936508 RepID=UPI00200E2CFB|nr:RidA family protein [Paenibacillus hamazuiensis]
MHKHGQAAAKLAELDIVLGAAPVPAGSYAPYKMAASFLYLSGVTPKENGVLKYKGKVGDDFTKEEGYQAARLCAVNQLAALNAALGDLDRVAEIVKVTGFIHAAPGFSELPYVLDGASDLLTRVFGDRGLHARSAVGVASLPGAAAVEVEMIVRYE